MISTKIMDWERCEKAEDNLKRTMRRWVKEMKEKGYSIAKIRRDLVVKRRLDPAVTLEIISAFE